MSGMRCCNVQAGSCFCKTPARAPKSNVKRSDYKHNVQAGQGPPSKEWYKERGLGDMIE